MTFGEFEGPAEGGGGSLSAGETGVPNRRWLALAVHIFVLSLPDKAKTDGA
jgi:hypothetical protein